MSGIPDDIMRAAKAVALGVFHNAVDSDDGSHSLDTPVASALIAEAIHAERQNSDRYKSMFEDAVKQHNAQMERAEAAERQRDQWQSMESAPKREHVILALPNGRVCEGYWGCAKYNRKTKTYDEAWVISPYSGDVQPTHWQHLPPAPKGGE